MSLKHITGREGAVAILSVAVVLFDALVQAGGTPSMNSIYLADFENQRVGLWATSAWDDGKWQQVATERSGSPGAMIHDVLFARYFLLIASASWTILTASSLLWMAGREKVFARPSYVGLLKPIGFFSLMVHGATALTVSTLLRTLEKGTIPGVGVSDGGRISEAFLWLGFGLTFLVMLLVLEGELFGRPRGRPPGQQQGPPGQMMRQQQMMPPQF